MQKASDELARQAADHTKLRQVQASEREAVNEEVRSLSVELCKLQSELEETEWQSRNYEAQLEFLSLEKDIIGQAQKQASQNSIPLEMQVTTLAEANSQKQKLETTLDSLKAEWEQTCVAVSDEL